MRGSLGRVFGIAVILLAAASGFMIGRGHGSRPARADSGQRRVLYWIDPMHPAYKSDHAGIAPDCGMQLEPVYADSSSPAAASSLALVSKAEGNHEDQVSQLAVVRVARSAASESLRVPGRVIPDETRVYKITAGVDGFVKDTHDDAAGNFVKKDQRLAVIYSPEFLTVLGGYLSASERTQNTTSKEGAAAAQGITGVQNWSDRLRNQGVSDAQIEELGRTRKIPEDIYVVSPVNGFVLSRTIAANERFERHTEFYRIADLSRVWIMADVASEQAEYLRPGATARVIGPDLKSTFTARVSNVLPQVDPVTRIVKLRLEADNPHFALRPEMLVQIEFTERASASLSLPRDAVLNSGREQLVFVKTSNGSFEPRTVATGRRFQDRIEILRGLAEGEWVAATASFAIDSEARLKNVSLPLHGSGRRLSPAGTKNASGARHARSDLSRATMSHGQEHESRLSGGQP